MDKLDSNLIQLHLADTIFRAVYCFPEVNSTNTQLMLSARFGEPEGTVYVAERQTAGRGRFKRPWIAPPGKALLFSFLLYPERPDDNLGLLPMTAALAAAETIDNMMCNTNGMTRASIKWPNDVMVGERKIGGVLAEMERIQGGRRNALVVGMGLNVNQTVAEMPERPHFPATSLLLETGRESDRAELLVDVLRRFSNYYASFQIENPDELIEALRRRMATLGQPVAASHNGERLEGTAQDLSPRGGLIIRLNSGMERELLAADVETLDWCQ